MKLTANAADAWIGCEMCEEPRKSTVLMSYDEDGDRLCFRHAVVRMFQTRNLVDRAVLRRELILSSK